METGCVAGIRCRISRQATHDGNNATPSIGPPNILEIILIEFFLRDVHAYSNTQITKAIPCGCKSIAREYTYMTVSSVLPAPFEIFIQLCGNS